MRILVLLRGAAGCGKSTWLRKNGLEPYTISSDAIRLLFQGPITNVDNSQSISLKNDHLVWKLLFELVEKRMERGEFTIVDATHARAKFINKYRQLARDYRYRVYVVEFDVDLETNLERNANREALRVVPEDVIRTMQAQIETQRTPGWVKSISPGEFFELFSHLKIFDFSEYDAIHHIGDIHGCFDPLMEFFNDVGFNDNEMYIFVGDYFDRGPQNVEVFNFMYSIMNEPNVLMLEGNHEIHVWRWAHDLESYSKEFANHTQIQFENARVSKKDARQFYRKLGQLAWYEYNRDVLVLVTHGGLPEIPNAFTPTREIIKGVGKYGDVDKVQETFYNLNHPDDTPMPVLQIHGHRNVRNEPIRNLSSYNLCDTIEFGGHLRVLTLEKNRGEVIERFYKNDNVSPRAFESTRAKKVYPDLPEDNIVDILRSSNGIKEKKLGDNISSFNFSRKVFTKKEWSALTTIARGLFINTANGKVVARGYDKFFNLGEVESTRKPYLLDELKFPLDVYRKENGFLGIVGYDDDTGLFIASKTTNQGDFKNWFEEILRRKVNMRALESIIEKNNMTLLFEVIDPVNDPHMIEYDEADVILLDAVQRTIEYKRFSYDDVVGISEAIGCSVKERIAVLEDWENFEYFVNCVETIYDFTLGNSPIEGVVIEDTEGKLIKIKFQYYSTWRYLRNLKDRIAKGRDVDTRKLTNEVMNRFYAWAMKQDREYLLENSIIDLRLAYAREGNVA